MKATTSTFHKRNFINSLILLISSFALSALTKDVYLDLTQYELGATYPSVLEVEARSKLVITLKENPTTGYRWMVID